MKTNGALWRRWSFALLAHQPHTRILETRFAATELDRWSNNVIARPVILLAVKRSCQLDDAHPPALLVWRLSQTWDQNAVVQLLANCFGPLLGVLAGTIEDARNLSRCEVDLAWKDVANDGQVVMHEHAPKESGQ